MPARELRKLVIAAIAAAVVPAAIMVGTRAVRHSVPAARHLVATSGAGVATGLSGSRPQAGRTIPAVARPARGQSARTVSVPPEIRAAASGETVRGGVVHVAVTHGPVPLPATFEIGPAPPKPDVSVACVTCRGNVLEVNF